MSPSIATAILAAGVLGLFALDRDRTAQTSKGLWIAVVWLFFNASRSVSQWLQLSYVQDRDHLNGNPFDQMFFSAVLFVALLILVSRRRQVGTLLRSNSHILLFFAYCGFSVLWSDYPNVAFVHWVKAVGDFVMVLVVLTDVSRTTAFKRLLTRAGFWLVPISILYIKYYPALGRVYSPWTWTWSAVGVTGNKNELGMLCMLIGLGSVWRLTLVSQGKQGTRKGPVIAHTALLAMVLWLFWEANSMTSLSCFLLGSGLLVTLKRASLVRKPAVAHLLVGAAISLVLFGLFLDPGGALKEGLGRDPTLTGRTEIWKGLIGMAVDPLLGAGFESFWLGTRLRLSHSLMWRLNEAHSGYLEVYLNLGWIGVTLLTLIVVKGYRKIIAELRRDPDMARIMLAYFTAELIYSLTEAGFRMLSPTWFLFLLSSSSVPRANVKDASTPLRTVSSETAAKWWEPTDDLEPAFGDKHRLSGGDAALEVLTWPPAVGASLGCATIQSVAAPAGVNN